MLKQVPKVSNTTVHPLVQAYPTPTMLLSALKGQNVSEGRSLLSELDLGNRKVGDAKALEVYYAFTAGGVDGVVEEAAAAPGLAGDESAVVTEEAAKKPAAKPMATAKKPKATPTAKPKVATQHPKSATEPTTKPVPKPAKRQAVAKPPAARDDSDEVIVIDLDDTPPQRKRAVVAEASSPDSWDELMAPSSNKKAATPVDSSQDSMDLPPLNARLERLRTQLNSTQKEIGKSLAPEVSLSDRDSDEIIVLD